ncbi:MAG TPA: MmcQ/YjbR family DNA-binding protein [Solirubrobacteraceae bacterium]|nr:MmcQ/YjbR family DNA-binding protein [Solirubrobacteraceae bacterium]
MPAWEDVLAIGRGLPEVEEGTWFRTPCLRVRKKSFCRMKEDGETLVVRVVDLEDKDALLRSAPGVFFTTPHYDGYPYVLVRLEQVELAQLAELIEDAWRLSAPKRVLAAYDAER